MTLAPHRGGSHLSEIRCKLFYHYGFRHDKAPQLLLSYFFHNIQVYSFAEKILDKKNKILSLREHLKKGDDGKLSLIYKKHIVVSGLVETYGKNLIEAVNKRDEIAVESFKYIQKKTKGLSF